jgi:hypothetical protein
MNWSQPVDPKKRLPALQWPRLSISPDMGSDGVCAISYWMFALHGNVDVAWDISHGNWDHILNAIRYCGLFEHILNDIIRINVPVGPWKEDVRYKQALQCLDEMFKYGSPRTNEVFVEMGLEMLVEEAGRDFAEDEDPYASIWDNVGTQHPFATKNTKCVLGRFLDVIRRIRSELKHFGQRKFCYVTTSLELGMLTGTFVTRPLKAKSAPVAGTSAETETSEEAALRKSCVNTMVRGTMQMLDPDTRRLDTIIVCQVAVWEERHSTQNVKLRSAQDSLEWVQGQPNGEFIKTAVVPFKNLTSNTALIECEFRCPTHENFKAYNVDEHLDSDETMAKHFAHLAIGLTYHRLKRMAWLLLGPSARSALFSKGGATAQTELDQMLQDKRNDDHFRTIRAACPGVEPFITRSIYNHVAVQQVIKVMQEAGLRFSEPVVSFFQSHAQLAHGLTVDRGRLQCPEKLGSVSKPTRDGGASL